MPAQFKENGREHKKIIYKHEIRQSFTEDDKEAEIEESTQKITHFNR